MKLVCVVRGKKDSVWELSGFRTTIGRDSTSDIVINDPKSSRLHAEIIREGDSFIFCDKDSLNGSFINNVRVAQHELVPGDQIKIGDTEIRVIGEELSATIEWHKQEPFITAKMPLDRFTGQIDKIGPAHETIIQEHPVSRTEEQIQTEKSIKSLETLYQVGRTINSIQTVEELLDQIAESLLTVYSDVRRVCILLTENRKDLEPKIIKTKAAISSQPFEISWSIVKAAVKEKVCILANDVSR